MSRLRSFMAIRTCLSSSSTSPYSSSLFKLSVPGNVGLLKSCAKNFRTASTICAPKFGLLSSLQRNIVQNINTSGKILLGGSFLGLSGVTALMYNQPIVAYADDNYAGLGGASGYLKDDIHTFWSLARKFELPFVFLVMVMLGWRHPITLAINIALLLLCTKPSPPSIYLFIEQLRQLDMRQDPKPFKTKFLYVKNVKVNDYTVMCLAKVELRDVKLDVIGILGGWWVFQTSRT